MLCIQRFIAVVFVLGVLIIYTIIGSTSIYNPYLSPFIPNYLHTQSAETSSQVKSIAPQLCPTYFTYEDPSQHVIYLIAHELLLHPLLAAEFPSLAPLVGMDVGQGGPGQEDVVKSPSDGHGIVHQMHPLHAQICRFYLHYTDFPYRVLYLPSWLQSLPTIHSHVHTVGSLLPNDSIHAITTPQQLALLLGTTPSSFHLSAAILPFHPVQLAQQQPQEASNLLQHQQNIINVLVPSITPHFLSPTILVDLVHLVTLTDWGIKFHQPMLHLVFTMVLWWVSMITSIICTMTTRWALCAVVIGGLYAVWPAFITGYQWIYQRVSPLVIPSQPPIQAANSIPEDAPFQRPLSPTSLLLQLLTRTPSSQRYNSIFSCMMAYISLLVIVFFLLPFFIIAWWIGDIVLPIIWHGFVKHLLQAVRWKYYNQLRPLQLTSAALRLREEMRKNSKNHNSHRNGGDDGDDSDNDAGENHPEARSSSSLATWTTWIAPDGLVSWMFAIPMWIRQPYRLDDFPIQDIHQQPITNIPSLEGSSSRLVEATQKASKETTTTTTTTTTNTTSTTSTGDNNTNGEPLLPLTFSPSPPPQSPSSLHPPPSQNNSRNTNPYLPYYTTYQLHSQTVLLVLTCTVALLISTPLLLTAAFPVAVILLYSRAISALSLVCLRLLGVISSRQLPITVRQ